MSSAICFNLDQSKIMSCGNGLRGIDESSDLRKAFTLLTPENKYCER